MKATFADESGCEPRFGFGDCGLLVLTKHVQETLNAGMNTDAQGWGLGTECLPLRCPANRVRVAFVRPRAWVLGLNFSLKQKAWSLTTEGNGELCWNPEVCPDL